MVAEPYGYAFSLRAAYMSERPGQFAIRTPGVYLYFMSKRHEP